MTPYKHADLIKAWADGAEIETKLDDGDWFKLDNPIFFNNYDYRIKPTPVPNISMFAYLNASGIYYGINMPGKFNVKVTFDGTTKELIAVEIIE